MSASQNHQKQGPVFSSRLSDRVADVLNKNLHLSVFKANQCNNFTKSKLNFTTFCFSVFSVSLISVQIDSCANHVDCT